MLALCPTGAFPWIERHFAQPASPSPCSFHLLIDFPFSRKSVVVGVDEEAIEDVDDADDPKAAILALLL